MTIHDRPIQEQIAWLEALDADIERAHRLNNEAEAQPIKPVKPLNWFTDLGSTFWTLIACAALAYMLSHISIPVRIIGG